MTKKWAERGFADISISNKLWSFLFSSPFPLSLSLDSFSSSNRNVLHRNRNLPHRNRNVPSSRSTCYGSGDRERTRKIHSLVDHLCPTLVEKSPEERKRWDEGQEGCQKGDAWPLLHQQNYRQISLLEAVWPGFSSMREGNPTVTQLSFSLIIRNKHSIRIHFSDSAVAFLIDSFFSSSIWRKDLSSLS